MRIAFDVTSCAKPQRGGIAGYGWNLLGALQRLAPDNEYVLGLRPNRWTRRELIADLLPGSPRALLLDPLPPLTLGHPDVYHGIGVRLPVTRAFPKVVMLHDLNVFEFPELSDPGWRTTRQAKIRATLRRADIALAYSQQGAEALEQHVGFPRERVRVIPLGVDLDQFRRPPADVLARVIERHGLTERPYLLNVGAFGTRKNQIGLLRAFVKAELPEEWVLVLGGPRGDDASTLAAAAEQLELPADQLRLPGWVGADELPALLSGAAMYVCSSLHEGFGLPVLEAQACGAPVVSSRRGGLEETVGDCGLLFDPADEDDFAAALALMAREDELRRELTRRGPERVAGHFTWERVARDTLAVYAELTGGRALRSSWHGRGGSRT